MRLSLLIPLLALITLSAHAHDKGSDTVAAVRPVVSAFTAEAGSVHTRDTYLTPLAYCGWQAAIGYERLQAMRFSPRHWVMRLDGRGWFNRTLNPAHSAEMFEIGIRPSWSMMWRTRLPHGFTLAVGPTIAADLGVLYLMRNSNNPASARASVTVGATGMAVWNGSVGRLPITLRYQPTMPLTGAFFSPQYDELYYEIWLGNHAGLAHCAWPGNFFRLDNYLSADLHLGNTILRLGYRCETFSARASGITTRAVSHTFVIGVATQWLSLRPSGNKTPQANIISPLYDCP